MKNKQLVVIWNRNVYDVHAYGKPHDTLHVLRMCVLRVRCTLSMVTHHFIHTRVFLSVNYRIATSVSVRVCRNRITYTHATCHLLTLRQPCDWQFSTTTAMCIECCAEPTHYVDGQIVLVDNTKLDKNIVFVFMCVCRWINEKLISYGRNQSFYRIEWTMKAHKQNWFAMKKHRFSCHSKLTFRLVRPLFARGPSTIGMCQCALSTTEWVE